MTPIKIDFPFFDLSTDRMQQTIAQWILLEDNNFTFHVECHVEAQPKADEGEYLPKEKYINYTGRFHRANIAGVDLDFTPSSDGNELYDVWLLTIYITGSNQDIAIKMDTQAFAREIYSKITDYVFNK